MGLFGKEVGDEGRLRKSQEVMMRLRDGARISKSGDDVQARSEIFNPVGKITTSHVMTLDCFSHQQSSAVLSYNTPRRTTSVCSFANMHMHVSKAPQLACGDNSAARTGRCGSAYLTPAVQCVACFDNITLTVCTSGWGWVQSLYEVAEHWQM